MIYQTCFRPEQSVSVIETPMYVEWAFGSQLDPALSKNCPELLEPEFLLQIDHFAALLYLWRNPPEDQHDWVGFSSRGQQAGSEKMFSDASEIELLLEKNEILSGSKYHSNRGVAAETEKCHPGITSFILGMFADLNEKIPGDYFELNIGFTTDFLVMRLSSFRQFMGWLSPFIQYGYEKMKTDQYLLQNPEKGLGVVLDRLFINWYLKQNWTVFDCGTQSSYINGVYETNLSPDFVSLGCVNYKREADENLREATRSGRIANGKFVEELEAKFCDQLNVKHAIAVCNGTMADAIALSAIAAKTGIKNVITPALTFIAQANAILHAGLNPVFVDVGKEGLLEDIPDLVENGDSIVYPVHLMGKVCRSVSQLSERYPVLEDSCEALGSQVEGRYAGTMGMAGTFSMYVSHSFTCGEGGMIVTNDTEIAELCRSIRAHGRLGDAVNERFRFPRLGFNGKMSNLQAAFATAHFDDFEQIIERRKQIVQELADQLGDDFGVASENIVAHGFPVMYADRAARDRALTMISQQGVECRPLFSCIATEHFHAEGEFPNAEAVSSRFLYVPCHHQLSDRDLRQICQAVRNSVEVEIG